MICVQWELSASLVDLHCIHGVLETDQLVCVWKDGRACVHAVGLGLLEMVEGLCQVDRGRVVLVVQLLLADLRLRALNIRNDMHFGLGWLLERLTDSHPLLDPFQVAAPPGHPLRLRRISLFLLQTFGHCPLLARLLLQLQTRFLEHFCFLYELLFSIARSDPELRADKVVLSNSTAFMLVGHCRIGDRQIWLLVLVAKVLLPGVYVISVLERMSDEVRRLHLNFIILFEIFN